MDASLVTLSVVGLALVPVVLGLTQIVKSFVKDSRWYPVISIVLGVVLAFVAPAATIALTLLQGVLIGLAASGLFSGAKTILTTVPSNN